MTLKVIPMTLKVIHLLHAFLNAIICTVVQQLTGFKLTLWIVQSFCDR